MVTVPELKDLQERKQLLVAKSDIHRLTFQLECQRLKSSTAWVTRSANFLRSYYPVLLTAAPIAGFLLTKRRKKTSPSRSGVASKLLTAWQIYRKCAPAIKFFRSKRDPEP